MGLLGKVKARRANRRSLLALVDNYLAPGTSKAGRKRAQRMALHPARELAKVRRARRRRFGGR